MARTTAIGVQNFSEIIENNYFYVDKTSFIKEWWENGDEVTLITRPRRFGKTLAMSMLEHYFSVRYNGESALFKNLFIWKEEGYRKLQGTFPVIFFSFANIKGDNFEKIYYDICKLIAREYRKNAFLLDRGCLLQSDKKQFEKILDLDVNDSDICSSLNQLSEYLHEYYGKKVIILLDEYDTPMQEAYVNGFWDKLINFLRRLLNATFKTNPYLKRGLMTGITRVSKESIFSDLNNLEVITTTSRKYETVFGFTEKEVLQALEEYRLSDKADEVKRWYDGFRFGECDNIYNPWSVLNYLDKKNPAPYWANTSSNALVGKIIQESDGEIKKIVEDLIEGKSFRIEMDEQIVFNELDTNRDAIWSLLLASGYLKIKDFHAMDYELALTNLETVFVFRKMIRSWFSACKSYYNDFVKSLLNNDLESMNEYLNQVLLATVSSFDSANQPSTWLQPEKFYHGLALGLILDLRDMYMITSNRESGLGRYDIVLEPRSRQDDGIIFEFKVFKPKKEKSIEDTVQSAIQQIIGKKYAVSLEEKGVMKDRIRIYGFAFRGKEVLIDGGYLTEFES